MNNITVKILNIQTPQNLAVVTLKFEQDGFTKSDAHKRCRGIANSVDPDQTAPQSDQGLHCLPRPICPKT